MSKQKSENLPIFAIHGDSSSSESNRMFNLSNFEYLINKSKCYNNNSVPYFISLVHSSPIHFDRRAACRDTWAHSDPRTKTYFLLGIVRSSTVQKKIDEEEAQYHDIIQDNFIDTYHNLTYKHTMALKWFSENCAQIKYLVKLDDDVFVNVPAVYEYLVNNTNDRSFLMGPYREPEAVHRDGKWRVSRDEFIDEKYPEFAEGSTLIYSNDFVKEAYRRTFTTRFFWVDDVYFTGIIRSQMNVEIQFIYEYLLSGEALQCVLDGIKKIPENLTFLFSQQSLQAQDMRKLWEYVEPFRRTHLNNA